MPHYVVGRDWPDHFYATNARWPEPSQWTTLPGGRTRAFRASTEEAKRARELEAQAVALREARKLKKQLFAAIIQRDLLTVQQLVRRTPLLLERHTPAGATPLGLAAAVGDSPLVGFLLSEGCDVAAGDAVGATPLIAAAARGHTQVCVQLLSCQPGANAGRLHLLRQATRGAGEAALHAAAKGGHLDTLAALLAAAEGAAGGAAAGAGVAAGVAAGGAGAGCGLVGMLDKEGRDCLMMAAANDHTHVMSYLLRNHPAEISPFRTDKLGRTALMYAAGGGAVQAVQLLLSAMTAAARLPGSSPPPSSAPASQTGPPQQVPAPLHSAPSPQPAAEDAGAAAGSTSAGATPAAAAAAAAAFGSSSLSPAAVAAAGAAGAAGGGGDHTLQQSQPQQPQQQQQQQQQPALASVLLGARDAEGYTALHHACLGGSVEVIELLCQRGLALPPGDPLSLQLLRLACGAGHGHVVNWLLRAGVGVAEVQSEGRANPLFDAVAGGSTAVVDVLLAHGGRTDPRDSRGRTPLHAAAQAGATAVCVHLVRAGADLRAVDCHGRVPRCLAQLANKRDTAEALSHMARMQLLLGEGCGDSDEQQQQQQQL